VGKAREPDQEEDLEKMDR